MTEISADDPFFLQLCGDLSDSEIVEVRQYLEEWAAGSYTSAAHSAIDHALRKGIHPLRYLRKAHNFSRRGAKRVPKSGYRADGSAVYRKGSEYLIVRLDSSGVERIVTYGLNDD